ncbi:hypothetical protein MCOR25_009818 [Pyricularia grisea]|nr:hypothetical protein MCOR25_009818 [Pyricularia grisea]
MRFSAVIALLPLALASPIPDNKSSQASNHIKDNGNKGADIANSEVADIQRAQSVIKNKQSPKAAENQLSKDLSKGVALRKTNQALLKKLPANSKRENRKEGEEGAPDNEGQVVDIRPTLPDAQQDDEQPPHSNERTTVIETRGSKKQATATLDAIEKKQNGATKTVKGLKGTGADSATLEDLKKSFQNGNAKLSAFTGQVPGRK